MTFRPATADDEEFFWEWRRKSEDEDWYGGRKTTRDEHSEWFRDRLARVTLLVWERQDHGGPVGCVRIDSNGEVAFSARPDMAGWLLNELKFMAPKYGGRLKITVDVDDTARIAALNYAAFTEFPVKFFCYRP